MDEVAVGLRARLGGEGWAIVDVGGDGQRTTLGARKGSVTQTYALRQAAGGVEVLLTYDR